MKYNFPINEVNFEFKTFGTAEIIVRVNDIIIKNFPISKEHFKVKNKIDISFIKKDFFDQTSYAILDKFTINGKSFTDNIKDINYEINTNYHKLANPIIKNNLYFGYIGKMTFDLEQDNSLLTRAAWTLADKEFEYVKWPMKGYTFRLKDPDTIYRDAQFMFVGVHNLKINPLMESYETMTIKELDKPLNISTSKMRLEDWINSSSRFKIKNLNNFKHFTLSTGVQESLQSFINRSNTLFIPKKNFEGNGEIFENKSGKVFDLLTEEIIPNSSIILEIPAPWYDTKKLLSYIKVAKEQNCQVAIDATWLPMTNETIELDLTDVDEIYFSMNKAWPVDNFRPAFRWSKNYIKDAQTFSTLNCTYPKVGFQIFFNLLEKFDIDWTYNYFKSNAEELYKTFNLQKTNILWFTKKKDKTVFEKHIGKYFHLEEFVSLVELLRHKNKYFW